jgi:cytoskeletal protein RodZ
MSSRRRRAIEDSEDEGDDDVDRSSSSVSGESEGDDEKHVLDDNEPAPKGPEENEEEEDDSSQEWSEDAQVVADGAEGATGDGQEELPKEGKRESRKPRPADPAYVPTQGVFYLHDDRESVSLPRQPR